MKKKKILLLSDDLRMHSGIATMSRELVLGSVYDSNFFNDVKNAKIKSALKKIIDETQEDLEYFKEQRK